MKKLIISVTASLFVYGVLGSAVWAGPSIQESVVTYGFGGETCDSDISEVLEIEEHGNKLRLLLHNEGIMVSDDSRISGPSTVNVEVFINNINGHITAHGYVLIEPSAHAGTWEGDFNIQVPGGRLMDVGGLIIIKDSQMNLRGTGEFDGQWFFFSHGQDITDGDPPVDAPDGHDGCEFTGEIFTGTILNPNAN
jgi:hypothetical protein